MNPSRPIAIALAIVLCATPSMAADLRNYVWQKLEDDPAAANTPQAQALRAELAGEVRKILDAGPIASAPFTIGIGGTFICYANSGEMIFALSEALPFLPRQMQGDVKRYMAELLVQRQPWTPSFLAQPVDGAWPHHAPRPPSPAQARAEVPLVNAYFYWKYADATADWSAAEAAYPALLANFIRRVKAEPEDYPQTLAAIGLARLARQLGRTEEWQRFEARALAGLAATARYEPAFDASYGRHITRRHDWSYPPFIEQRANRTIITGFAPEIFRMLRDHDRDGVRFHAGAVMNAWARTWFITRASLPAFYGQYYYERGVENAPRFMRPAWAGAQHDFGQENAYLTPDVAATLFLLNAYVLAEYPADAARYLDVPWTRVGDVYHIQKLVALLRAHAPPQWVDLR